MKIIPKIKIGRPNLPLPFLDENVTSMTPIMAAHVTKINIYACRSHHGSGTDVAADGRGSSPSGIAKRDSS